MRLAYVAQVGLKDDWAQTVQIMKMCEAFAQNGAEVTLVVPRRREDRSSGTAFEYFGISPIFRIIQVPYIDIFHGSADLFLYWLRFISFLVIARLRLVFQKFDVIYTREMYFAPFFRNVYLERHSLPKVLKPIHRYIFKKVAGIVVLTNFIKARIVEFGIASEKVLVASDAVRLEDFESADLEQTDWKLHFGLPQDKYIFGYIGTLKTMGEEKGVGIAIDSLAFLPDKFLLYIVGGEPKHIEFYKQYVRERGCGEKVIFAGRVPHKDIPKYIKACDVVVAPFPENEHYSYFMSPLKIFEYMAGKRSIISTSLPSIKEVLRDGENALLVAPGSPEALANALQKIKNDPELGMRLVVNAYKDIVEKYTWTKRAKRILDFMTSGI